MFCTHCGRPLAEGEVCTCQTAKQPEAPAPGEAPEQQPAQAQYTPAQSPSDNPPPAQQYQQPYPQYQQPYPPQYQQPYPPQYQQPYPQYQRPAAPQGPSASSIYFGDLGKAFIGVFTKPTETYKKIAEGKKWAVGVTYAGLEVIFSMIFFLALAKYYNSGYSVSLITGLSVGHPWGMCLLAGFLLAVLTFAAVCGISILAAVIFKGKTDFLATMGVIGTAAIVPACLTFIGALLTFASYWCAIIFGGFALFTYAVSAYAATRSGLELKNDDANLYFGGAFAAVMIIMYVILHGMTGITL